MTGATVCKWSVFHPVLISRLKHGCLLPQISVAKEESLNGRDVRWCCLCTVFSPGEAQVSNTVQLLRALPPDCSVGVANFCLTPSPCFSHCPSRFCKRKEYLWSSLSITHFLETTHLLWYYWIIMEGLQLFLAFWPSGSLAVIVCWFLQSNSLERNVFPKHKNVAMNSHSEVLGSMWAYKQFSSRLSLTYSWSGHLVMFL